MNTLLFDLDGTLLSMDHEAFEKLYFGSLTNYLNDYIDRKVLSGAIQKAIYQTIMDTSDRTIEASFFYYIEAILGKEVIEDLRPLFNQYYEEIFIETKSATSSSHNMIEAVQLVKNKGYQVMVVTNPLFPQLAIDARIEWAGFNRDDFAYVTSFEKNHYCKPNIELYQEVLALNGLEGNQCLMVGNHCFEDMIASKLGMKTYLIEDEMIEHTHGIAADHQGTRSDFLVFCKGLPTI